MERDASSTQWIPRSPPLDTLWSLISWWALNESACRSIWRINSVNGHWPPLSVGVAPSAGNFLSLGINWREFFWVFYSKHFRSSCVFFMLNANRGLCEWKTCSGSSEGDLDFKWNYQSQEALLLVTRRGPWETLPIKLSRIMRKLKELGILWTDS